MLQTLFIGFIKGRIFVALFLCKPETGATRETNAFVRGCLQNGNLVASITNGVVDLFDHTPAVCLDGLVHSERMRLSEHK